MTPSRDPVDRPADGHESRARGDALRLAVRTGRAVAEAQTRTVLEGAGGALARGYRAARHAPAAAASLRAQLRGRRRCSECVAAAVSAGRCSAGASGQAIVAACREAVQLRMRLLIETIRDELGEDVLMRAGERTRSAWHRLGPVLARLGVTKDQHRTITTELAAIDRIAIGDDGDPDEIDLADVEARLAQVFAAVDAILGAVEAQGRAARS